MFPLAPYSLSPTLSSSSLSSTNSFISLIRHSLCPLLSSRETPNTRSFHPLHLQNPKNKLSIAQSIRIGDLGFRLSLFLTRSGTSESLKKELLEAIAPLDRGANATPEERSRVDKIARKLEAVSEVKEPLKSKLLDGKWELLYTTSTSILQTQRPKLLRPNGKIYQAINVDTLRGQNMETWPFFNQATANLVPLNARRVAVKFDAFKIFGLIPVKSRGSGRGQLEITYLDEDIRISRGNQGNLFILKMVDPSCRVPL